MHSRTPHSAFESWFSESAVVGPGGEPLVVYRGEHGSHEGRDLQTRLGSVTFSASPEAASLYALEPNDGTHAVASRVVSAYLSIKKPIINDPDDPFTSMSVLIDALGYDYAARFAIRHQSRLSEGVWECGLMDDGQGGTFASIEDLIRCKPENLGALYFLTFVLLDDPELVAMAQMAGFDGAIHMGFGDFDDTEYRIFSPHQAKSAIGNRGTYDGSDPDITHSRAEGAGEGGGHGWPLTAYGQAAEAGEADCEALERPRMRG